MTPDAFFTPLEGQSLLIPGQAEAYRGQCVQSVGLWVQELGFQFPAYSFAYQYYVRGILGFDNIPAGQPIKQGDVVVWGKNFPSSPNAGHIDVAAEDGTLEDFWGWDSNWSPPLELEKIHHTGPANNYIVGYLRLTKGEDMVDDAGARDILANSMILAQDGDKPDRQPTVQEIESLVGKPYGQALREVRGYQPWKDNYAKVKYYTADVANAAGAAQKKLDQVKQIVS